MSTAKELRHRKVYIYMSVISSLLGIFGCSVSKKAKHVEMTAQLNHLIMPVQRGERYEDPLNEALSEKGYGVAEGGGTMQKESGEIEFIDVEISVKDTSTSIPFVIEQLEKLGAPKGSLLRIYDTNPPREIPFGTREGVAVYLDGTGLPEEVYKASDINVVIEEISKRIEPNGKVESYWKGPAETALYFYGENADTMKNKMKDFIDSYPLCKNARVITIAPKQE